MPDMPSITCETVSLAPAAGGEALVAARDKALDPQVEVLLRSS